ncbi:MAG: SCO family protein [Calditrichia bacterium]
MNFSKKKCYQFVGGPDSDAFNGTARFFLTALLLVLSGFLFMPLRADVTPPAPEKQEIGVVEHLGEKVPLDLKFADSHGDSVKLSDIVDKPTVLSLVYYNCPGICSPLLNGMVDVLDRMSLTPGKDYEVITLSFNPAEGPDLASAKKKNHFAAFRKTRFPEDHWIWLTGDSVSIKKLTDAVGFKYRKEGDQFIHAGVLTVLSADGQISRYLRGIEFQPFDLKMAITEASEGRTGPTVSKLLLYCFSYDPAGKTYVLNFTKIFGTAFLVVLVLLVGFLTYQGKVREKKVRT